MSAVRELDLGGSWQVVQQGAWRVMTVTDEATTRDSQPRTTVGGNSPSRWMNGTVTGTVLASVLVAALDHRRLRPDPVYDIA